MATSFVMACSKYFGRKPGQSLMEFNAELKQLTAGDRLELAQLLTQATGEEVADVAPVKAAVAA